MKTLRSKIRKNKGTMLTRIARFKKQLPKNETNIEACFYYAKMRRKIIPLTSMIERLRVSPESQNADWDKKYIPNAKRIEEIQAVVDEGVRLIKRYSKKFENVPYRFAYAKNFAPKRISKVQLADIKEMKEMHQLLVFKSQTKRKISHFKI